MSDTTYSRWYREGTVTISQNSKTLQGANTYWLNANIKPGDLFSIDSSKFYEVDTIDSNTQITLRTNFEESSITAGSYKIIRNFTATLAAETAAKVVEVLARNERYVNEDMKTVQGYSAYDLAVQNEGFVGTVPEWLNTLTAYGVAVKNGYVGTASDWLKSLTAYGRAVANGYQGTEEQWLESLKAAGEWSTLDERTKILTDINTFLNAAPAHNSIYRGNNLGEFTDEHAAAIYNRTYENMYVGDYFTIPSKGRFVIAEFETFNGLWLPVWNNLVYNAMRPHITLIPNTWGAIKNVCTPFNDTATTEGGYVASDFRAKYRQQYEEIYAEAFGEKHLFKHYDMLPAAHDNAGVTTGATQVSDSCVEIMDIIQYAGAYKKDLYTPNLNNIGLNIMPHQFMLYKYLTNLQMTNNKPRTWEQGTSLVGWDWGKGSGVFRNPKNATQIYGYGGANGGINANTTSYGPVIYFTIF